MLPFVVNTQSHSLPELSALGLSAWADDAMTITPSPGLPSEVRKSAFMA
jgi:hypothetical protein